MLSLIRRSILRWRLLGALILKIRMVCRLASLYRRHLIARRQMTDTVLRIEIFGFPTRQ